MIEALLESVIQFCCASEAINHTKPSDQSWGYRLLPHRLIGFRMSVFIKSRVVHCGFDADGLRQIERTMYLATPPPKYLPILASYTGLYDLGGWLKV